jgi:hypothetical protein
VATGWPATSLALENVPGNCPIPVGPLPSRLLGNPAACRGHKTDGVSPVESRSITPQGGEAVALPFGRPRGSNPVVDIT